MLVSTTVVSTRIRRPCATRWSRAICTIRSSYFRQLVVGKIGEFVQTQWDEHGSSGGGEAPGG
jgi:hypothetical protein